MGHSFLGFILPIYSTLTFLNPEGHFFSLSFFHSPSRPLSFLFLIFHFFFFPFFSLFSLIPVPPPLPLSSLTTTISLPQSNDFSHYPISFFLSFFSLSLYLSLSLCMCVSFPLSPLMPMTPHFYNTDINTHTITIDHGSMS